MCVARSEKIEAGGMAVDEKKSSKLKIVMGMSSVILVYSQEMLNLGGLD